MQPIESAKLLGGRYRLAEELGRGGFSIVYSAVDSLTGDEVAIKELRPPPSQRKQALARIRREAIALQQISHKNVIRLHDFFEEGETGYLVMDRLHGRDLHRLIKEKGRLIGKQLEDLAIQVLAGLQVAHAAGVLHRDLKPQNIFVTDEGNFVVLDFGSAEVDGFDTFLQGTREVMGSFNYTAPEILRGERGSRLSDVYSFGKLLEFAVTARTPDQNKSIEIGDEFYSQIISIATRDIPEYRFTSVVQIHGFFRNRSSLARFPFSHHTRQDCLRCNASHHNDENLCPACVLADQTKNTHLVFVKESESKYKSLLSQGSNGLSKRLAKQTIAGYRPIFAIPETEIKKVKDVFAKRNLAVQIKVRWRSYTVMPPFLLMLNFINVFFAVVIIASASIRIGLYILLGLAGAWLLNCLTRGVAVRPQSKKLKRLAGSLGQLRKLPFDQAHDLDWALGYTIYLVLRGYSKPSKELAIQCDRLLNKGLDSLSERRSLDPSISSLREHSRRSHTPNRQWLNRSVDVEAFREHLVGVQLESLAACQQILTNELNQAEAIEVIKSAADALAGSANSFGEVREKSTSKHI